MRWLGKELTSRFENRGTELGARLEHSALVVKSSVNWELQ